MAWLVVACVLPGWLATGYFTYDSYRNNRARIETVAHTAARQLMLVIERELAGVAAGLEALSTSPAIDRRDLPGFSAQAKQVLAQQNGLNILLIDADGQQLVNTLRPPGQPLPKEPHSALMLKVLETKRPSNTDLFWGPVLKKHLVALVVPVLREGKVHAFLSMSLDAQKLGALLDLDNAPPAWKLMVYDSKGRVIAGNAVRELSMEQTAPPELMSAMLGRTEGALQVRESRSGAERWVFFQRSPHHGWIATLTLDQALLEAELGAALRLQLVGAVLLLALGLALANWLGRSISEPIRALVAPALALGRGEPVRLPVLGLAEAEAVRQSLVAAQELLRAREAERDAARSQSVTDGLTGLANRRALDEALEAEFRRARRTPAPLSLLLLDVDHFKLFNDAYGHLAGDQCLQQVASVIASQINRASDLAARYGGEEFAVVLPDTELSGALALAERIRIGICERDIPHRNSSAANHVTVSVGVATLTEVGDGTWAELIHAADQHLYAAKSHGRNRVCGPDGVPTITTQLPL